MSELSTSESSDVISFKVIGIGTAAVLAVAFIAWVSHVSAGERLLREQARLSEMAAESRALCEKWGMPDGSPKHAACLADIDSVRASHQRRISFDEEPF